MGDAARNGTLAFARTELFFGTARPDGLVLEEEFPAFMDEEVTPRFPDGLTLLKGDGQFKESDGVIGNEQSLSSSCCIPPIPMQKAAGRSALSVGST